MLQLPYLIDGTTKLTQSNTILRYLARKHNLAGTTEIEHQRIDVIENEAMDCRKRFVGLCYNPEFVSCLICPKRSKSGEVFLKKHVPQRDSESDS